MKIKCLAFLIFISFLPYSFLSASTIHAILLADTINDMGFATEPDVCRIQHELLKASQSTGMLYKEKIFMGYQLKRNSVVQYLTQLQCDPDDVVVFFFTGHGCRTYQKLSFFPDLNFEWMKPALDLKWIADTIRSKNPRFTLVIADCCNNFIERGYSFQLKDIQINLNPQVPNPSGYRQLFAQAKGCVIVSSSSPGQYAYGSRKGGLYTQCFISGLSRETHEKIPSWKHLLERVNSYIGKVQKPICEVYK